MTDVAKALSSIPPAHLGAIHSIEDLRIVLKRGLWAAEMAIQITPVENKAYLRGKRSVLTELLQRLDWPDACVKCGKSPVCDVIDGDALCDDCCDAWCIAEGFADADDAA